MSDTTVTLKDETSSSAKRDPEAALDLDELGEELLECLQGVTTKKV